MILVDTSVWIDHLRKGSPTLAKALEENRVLMHPFILGELACGNLRNREMLLGLLSELPTAPRATDPEALTFTKEHALMGRGLGYPDLHLLASVALADGARLWTTDKALHAVAVELGVAHAVR
ncbi:MAG: type II toxin-antitoxin system VapC family toxin [Truepera sp.]|nr:type II toxin-antitoxin system VapC family toxin [Truepera sp.]